MNIRSGERLRSAVCETQVIVIKAPDGDVDVRCGGTGMLALEAPVAQPSEPTPALTGGSKLGKRYESRDLGLEVLVTNAGAGTLSVGDEALAMKEAKKLPSSD
jgi:hypothetical protein